MKADENELPDPPAAAERGERAVEMVRIWIAEGNYHVVISPNLWKDAAAWGLMLVDLAKHVASVYEVQGHDRAAVLERIHEAFEVEWRSPTDPLAR